MNKSFRLTVNPLVLAAANLSAATLYVSSESTNPTPPYATWATAATNIHSAVGATTGSDEVVVTNGVYGGGLAVTNPLALRSVNGPQFTIINGGGTNWCVFLTDGASLTGFTVTNGADHHLVSAGAGVLCASTRAYLTNCVIVGNRDAGFWDAKGGGVYQGTLYDCTLSGNTAVAGQSVAAGGGAYGSILYACTLSDNSAGSGGGADGCRLYNCTLTGNSSTDYGGGADDSTLYNCIVYFNTSANGANYCQDQWTVLSFCCTTPMPTNGFGNVTNAPLFVDYAGGNLRLQSNSPCINAGNNAYVTTSTDLGGNPRIVSGTVDIGPYEYQGQGSQISYAWLQRYGLPTDGSADFIDSDYDALNNWQEWVCGTCPTNASSTLRLISALPTGTNVMVSWKSVAGVNYFLERGGSLAAPFTLLSTKIVGHAGTTTYTDTNAVGAGLFFYRVGVRYY